MFQTKIVWSEGGQIMVKSVFKEIDFSEDYVKLNIKKHK